MRKVIYTCLVGNIDSLIQPQAIDSAFDYICFTDSTQKQIGIWQNRPISDINGDNIYKSRFPKLLPHILLPDYDYSVYIDANVCILDKHFYERVNECINRSDLVSQVPHPTRKCIFLELEQCLNVRKVSPLQYIRHHQRYLHARIPHNWGLFENNVILRKHNDLKVIAIDEDWWAEYNRISNRDQLSLMLVYWKHLFLPTYLLGEGENTRNSTCVKCVQHQVTAKNASKNKIIKSLMYFSRTYILPIYRKIYGIKSYSSPW